MSTASTEKRYTPLIILMLVAALVTTLGLWARDKSIGIRDAELTADSAGAVTGRQFEWKLITTWPRHFPGLGNLRLRTLLAMWTR